MSDTNLPRQALRSGGSRFRDARRLQARALEKASAIVAAWLAGTEDGCIRDRLPGQRAPSAKLGVTRAGSMASIDANVLFPLGFGLD